MDKKLHIISFDVPYPPNYGGVIDVFFKIKALHKLGIEIILHSFEYGRNKPVELEQYCSKIYYYKRKSVLSVLSAKPFVVNSRRNDQLIANLSKDSYPILFEGIHTTYPLTNTDFNNRKILIRTHNIEHDYYNGLAKSEKKLLKKIFFHIEAKKLKFYEKVIHKTNYILTISPSEHQYFKTKFGEKCKYIPVFHKEESVRHIDKKGKFALYHGDLRVSDNLKAVDYLIKIFKTLDYPLIIASSFRNNTIIKTIKDIPNVKFVFIDYTNKNQLDNLFKDAHINVLPTFQATGIKLKLIHALYSSRFCVATPKMVANTGLETICEIGKTQKEFKEHIEACFNLEYTSSIIEDKIALLVNFNTIENAKKIIQLLNN